MDHFQNHRRLIVWEISNEAIRAIEAIMRPTNQLTATMRDKEIDAAINEAIEAVRSSRPQESNKHGDGHEPNHPQFT